MKHKTLSTELIRHGDLVAEVAVEIIPDDGAWGPYLSLDDALKLERVRKALERGDLGTASQESRLFKLIPVEQA